MDAPVEWVDDLHARIRAGRVAYVCGTGVTSAIARPSQTILWKGLLRHGVGHLAAIDSSLQSVAANMTNLLDSADASTNSLLTVAQWIRNEFDGLRPGEFRDWLKKTVGSLELSEDAPAFLALTNAPILTSNYDGLIGSMSGRNIIEWTDNGHLDQYFDEVSKYVYHLHGHWDTPDSVIMASTDYQRLLTAGGIGRVFEQIAGSYTLVFLGYGAGMQDPNYAAFLNWFGKNFGETVRAAYLLCRSEDYPTRGVDANGLRYIAYGDKFEDLWEYLEKLSPPKASVPPPVNSEDFDDVNHESTTGQVLAPLPRSVRDEAYRQVGPEASWNKFQEDVLVAEESLTRSGGGALVAAVTGTGKTTLSRLAMNLAVAQNSAAMMLVPTKALVAQELREWDTWITAWLADERQIRVYPSSRDYPESDAPVSRARFEVAIAIYEKVAGYLAAGHATLGKTSLLIVDELQTLVEDGDRARKLEALLTMVHLLPGDRRPGIVGLSATLSRESTDALRSWLKVPQGNFLTSVERPIPLDTYVVDARRMRVQRDSHLIALGENREDLPASEEFAHDLQIGEFAQKLGLKGIANAPIGVALIVKLLKEDPERRIIAFAPGRTAAEEIAGAIQRELDGALGKYDRKGSPWRVGRFANSVPDDAETRHDQIQHSDLPMSVNAIRGLRTGVAYHTARLPAQLRRLLEDEFRSSDGLLRVLVATNTLAQGVNLPADAVVSFSVTTYGQDRLPLLSTAAELDNKAGRAGRRGLAARDRGEFYILVPTVRDLQDVSNLTAASVKKLATTEGVLEKYVLSGQRTPRVTGRIRDMDDVALLTLQVLCSDGFGRRKEALEGRVGVVIQNLLAAQEEEPNLPTAAAVIERLRELKILTSEDQEKTRVTRLGLALGRSALRLGSAYVLEQLGRLATAGAGDIDLLFNAFRSAEIEEVSAWVGMPSVEARHKPSIKEKLTTYAMAYCAEGRERRGYCAAYFNKVRHPLVAEWVNEGQAVISPELRELLVRDVEQIDDREATALLRALVAFEWGRGVPFDELKARISSALTSDEDQRGHRPVEIKVHYSDVEQLCEQVAGVVRGAAEVSFSESHDWSVRISSLALRTEVGLPSWLAPIARLRHPLLHRNRLARLWKEQPVQDHLSEILELAPLKDVKGITEQQRLELKELLDLKESEDRLYRHRVAQIWANELVPGLDGATYEEFGEELEAVAKADDYLGLIAELAVGLGVETEDLPTPPGFLGTVWRAELWSVAIAIPEVELGEKEVLEIAEIDALIMLRTRLRPSAMGVLAKQPTMARFVRPEVLLELVAKLSQSRGAALDPAEVVERLAQLRVSVLDAESVSLSVDSPAGPPPFVGRAPEVPPGVLPQVAFEGNAD